MTTRVLYAVTATLPDKATADEYVAWLEDGHVDAVIAGGAHSAMIVWLDPDANDSHIRVETHYVFANRAALEGYLKRHAPRLRAEGLKKFGADRGVRFDRRVGEIL
jgi:hypothetical protein